MGILQAIPYIGGALEAGAGAIGANQRRQRNKGLISQAFRSGNQRLARSQADERQSQGEQLLARGLAQGGDVNTGRVAGVSHDMPGLVSQGAKPLTGFGAFGDSVLKRSGIGVTPGDTTSVSGARSLGGQQIADQHREQVFDTTDLRTNYANELQDNDQQATNEMLGAVAGGLGTAFRAYNAGQSYAAAPDPRTVNNGLPAGVTQGRDLSTTAYGGIDPVNPLGRGAWARKSVDSFNVNRGHV